MTSFFSTPQKNSTTVLVLDRASFARFEVVFWTVALRAFWNFEVVSNKGLWVSTFLKSKFQPKWQIDGFTCFNTQQKNTTKRLTEESNSCASHIRSITSKPTKKVTKLSTPAIHLRLMIPKRGCFNNTSEQKEKKQTPDFWPYEKK